MKTIIKKKDLKDILLIITVYFLIYQYIFPLHCKRICRKQQKGKMFNYCLEREVPRVTRILETAEYFFYTNKSMVIFGKEELELMDREKNLFMLKNNDDFSEGFEFVDINKQFSNKERIGIELMKIFVFPSEEMEICIPDVFYGYPPVYYKDRIYWKKKSNLRELLFTYADYKRQYFTSQISSPYKYTSESNCELLNNAFIILKKIWTNKNILIIKPFGGISYIDYFFNRANDIETFSVSLSNSLSNIERLKKRILEEDEERVIVFLINKPVFVILADQLVKEGRRVLMFDRIDIDYYKFLHKNIKYSDEWIIGYE